ncbi:MAG: DNA gyrase subunit A [Candidatus Pacebacteria bacterium]|nr:DNA gyrase subunit A [Candidatus Paceibacterota bacterium]
MEKEELQDIGEVKSREISEEMKDSYIDYAMSVIISRALPDVRDGLKPVHRRILYAMYEDGLRPEAKFRKSATVVGSCLGRYHPHGDQAVYASAIRMSQDFSLRYPMIQGQGNIGSIDDSGEFAAMRYTEMRMSKLGFEMLKDIEKDTVDFLPNYDATRTEPVVLPSPVPQLLLNGAMGIAVGMATNIPPHNLREVCHAAIYLIDNPEAETEDLFKFIQGPDFPTGGFIFDKKEIISAYSQGKGSILMRAKTEIVEREKGGFQIIINEIPFQVEKSALMQQLADLVQNKKVEGIKDIRDESDKEGMRIVIELQKTAIPQKVLNSLFKFSELEKSFHLNLLALVDGIQPKVLNLKEILQHYLDYREKVIYRRTKYDLEKAKERAHILEGISKALDMIDAVIATIRKSKDREDARNNLIKLLKIDAVQADAILEIRLHQLARLEKAKIEAELKEILKKIKFLAAILASKEKIKGVVKEELEKEMDQFGDDRKTKVIDVRPEKITEADLVPQEDTIITVTKGGYIKRSSPDVAKTQKRGGKGIVGMKTQEGDFVSHFILAKTHDSIFFFTDSGKVFQAKAYEIPEAQRTSRGRALVNFLEISPDDKILSILALDKKETSLASKYLVMITKNGIIKKTSIKEFENVRRNGLIAINLKKEDSLCGVKKAAGSDDIMIVTKKGQSIMFSEQKIRPMGRTAAGVKGISLKKGDQVIGMEIFTKDIQKAKNSAYLLILSENGYGKLTDLKEYRQQGRGGTGVKTANVTSKTGDIVKIGFIVEEEELIVISQKGQIIKTAIKSISKLGRVTQGVRIMKLAAGDRIASAAYI